MQFLKFQKLLGFQLVIFVDSADTSKNEQNVDFIWISKNGNLPNNGFSYAFSPAQCIMQNNGQENMQNKVVRPWLYIKFKLTKTPKMFWLLIVL
jgi:hypothetical protein